MPRSSTKLTPDRLRDLARAGAELTLKQLRAEMIAIERTFPELALSRRRQASRRQVRAAVKHTRTMSAAAREVVSARMKKYWAERREAKAKVK